MKNTEINKNYTKLYNEGKYLNVYPTEFVVRTLLQKKLPGLKGFCPPIKNSKILDVGFGDGRNTIMLCNEGYDVTGVEITQEICDKTAERLKALGYNNFKFYVGRNNKLPFEDNYFDYILASHSCYYLDEGTNFSDNLKEYCRILKPNGYVIFSIPHIQPEIKDEINAVNGAINIEDVTYMITNDPLGIRNGYRYAVFKSEKELRNYLSSFFKNIKVATADNVFWGVAERMFWVIAQK